MGSHSTCQNNEEKYKEPTTNIKDNNESLMKYSQSIFIDRQLSMEHRMYINNYKYYEDPNPNIFVKLDRYIFLYYNIEFISKNRPIIPIKGYMSVDYNNPFTY